MTTTGDEKQAAEIEKPVTVGDVTDLLDVAYPPSLAESWDKVGLVTGYPDAGVSRVVLAVDPSPAVVDFAVKQGADMLITHHPLLLRGVSFVAATTGKGRIVHTLIENKIALFAAHTNADSARPGVNDALAQALGMTSGRPIDPQPPVGDHIDKWGVQVPIDSVEAIKKAVFAAGGGAIGDYDSCCFTVIGTGQFRPLEGAHPASGTIGQLSSDREARVEFVAPRSLRVKLAAAIKKAHPYEEVAFDVVEHENPVPLEKAPGIGRVGELATPLRFADFVSHVAKSLPPVSWGVRGAGDPEAMISRVAVCSGAGDSFLGAVASLGVDAFVTSDLRHHPVDESLLAGGPCVVDTAHWASEFPWCQQAKSLLESAFGGLIVTVCPIPTDRFTLSAGREHETL